MQIRLIVALALFISGIALVIVANFMTSAIVEEINARSSSNRQIGLFFVQFKMDEIFRRHRDLFPDSGKRRWSTIIGILGGIMIFASYFVATSYRVAAK
jgi:uncharacterized membrane protein YdcZ (DUF606 family)